MEPEYSVLVILFLVCTLYCFVLEMLHDRYVPDWIWLTVVIGEAFVIGALGVMERYGVQLTAFLVFVSNGVAGAPIIVWQLWQAYNREREKHSGASARSASTPRRD